MNRHVMIVVLCTALCSCGTLSTDTTKPAVTVTMSPGAFSPDPITVQKGRTVCWVNEDTINRWPASNIHPTHEIYSEFDPKRGIIPGETWCFSFGRAGIWKYHDHISPELGGTVNVE